MRIFLFLLFAFCSLSYVFSPAWAENEFCQTRPKSSFCQALCLQIGKQWKAKRGFDDSVRFDIEINAQGKIQHVEAVDLVATSPEALRVGKKFFARLKNLPVPPSAIGEPLWLRVALSNNNARTFVRCRDIDMESWLADTKRRIKRSWYPPKDGPGGSSVIFKVHEDGQVSDLRLFTSSGVKCADDAALKAISCPSGYFRPMPDGTPGEIQLRFRFDDLFVYRAGSVKKPLEIVSPW